MITDEEAIERFTFLLHQSVSLIRKLAEASPLSVAFYDDELTALSKGMDMLADDMEGR